MPDTQRTISALQTLLADNASAAISAQDLRDFMETFRPRFGSLYVLPAGSAAVTIANTTNYVEVTSPTWTLDASAYEFDESDGNGRLTYTGTADVIAIITATVSVTQAAASQVQHWRLGINGTSDGSSEVQRKHLVAADQDSVALQLVVPMSTGDHISLFVRNSTGTNNPTIEAAQIQVHTIPAAA